MMGIRYNYIYYMIAHCYFITCTITLLHRYYDKIFCAFAILLLLFTMRIVCKDEIQNTSVQLEVFSCVTTYFM